MTVRILVVGDDFTQSALFASAIRQHEQLANRADLELAEVDLEGPYCAGPVDGVREFMGAPDDVIAHVGDAMVIVTTFAPITRAVIAAAPQLRLIVVGRGGPVNVDVDAAAERGIQVAFAPGRNAEAVAEYVIGLLLALTRRIPQAATWVHQGSWRSGREDTFDKPSGPELRGRTLGIVGVGAIGARVAELATAFGMVVLGYDPMLTADDVRGRGATPVSLPTLLAHADIVTVHARPPAGSAPVLGRDELEALRPGSYLINTSRGASIDQAAALQLARVGHLAGVALDVLDHEPLGAGDPLLACDSVLVTPHTAGVSFDVPRHTAEAVAARIAEWLVDGHPRHVVGAVLTRP